MLKKCLLGLFVGFVGLLGFSSATIISCEGYNCDPSTYSFPDGFNDITFEGISCEYNTNCDIRINFSDLNDYCDVIFSNSDNSVINDYCKESGLYGNANFVTWGGSFSFNIIDSSLGGDGSSCLSTGDILSGLCDTNYCVQNDLCPSSSGSRSELMINNIVHEGKPLISINIPDNIYWDYTGDENGYYIFVGSGYDQDYIDSVLAINSYRPDNKDFTNIFVSGLTLIFPYIFVALLILFIWKLLKRIFK